MSAAGMVEGIRRLEAVARRLAPAADERAFLLRKVADYCQRFQAMTATGPAYIPSDNEGRSLEDWPISEMGRDIDIVLGVLGEAVDTPALNPTSPRFLGYIPGGGIYHSALGDFLAAVSNRFAGIYFASPGAVRLEDQLLRWMAGVVGYPAEAGGNLASGGSIAGLAALVAARDAHEVEAEDVRSAVVYQTVHTHHAIDKALRIAGMRTCVRRIVAVDEQYRMRPEALIEAIRVDRKSGLKPWLVVASAGTTNTGTVDPLADIGDIAQANGLWFHADGAYGAFFALCEPGRRILSGIEKSDSVVLDPHKTLFVPYGLGAVLVRDRHTLYAAHRASADYMRDTQSAADTMSPANLSPELTKHFRGLRLWLPLQLLGVAPFRAALEEKMWLARYFHQRLAASEGFEVGPPPDLSIVTYRYLPPTGNADAFNERLVKAVQADGRIFISSTILDGKVMLRLAIGVFNTHLEEIEETIAVLQSISRRLLQD